MLTSVRMLLAVAVFSLALVCSQGATAQEKTGVFGSGGGNSDGGPFEFEVGGVDIKFQEIKQDPSNSSAFYVSFKATSKEDMIFKISRDGCRAYDNRGNECDYYGLWIGNKSTYERQIIGGVPTEFGFLFHRGNEIAELYPRIDVNIMGKPITLRNVPSSK